LGYEISDLRFAITIAELNLECPWRCQGQHDE
jgi:hypothetical protein